MELVNVAGVDLGSLTLHEVGAAHLTAHFSLQLLVVEGLVSLALTMSLLKFLDTKLELLDLLKMLTLLLCLLVLHPVHLSILLDGLLARGLLNFGLLHLGSSFLDNLLDYGSWLIMSMSARGAMSGRGRVARVHGL